jgi:hypothetical protein
MSDLSVFSKLLKIQKPWLVNRVSLDPEERHLDVWLAHRRNASFTRPACGTRSPLHDHVSPRS